MNTSKPLNGQRISGTVGYTLPGTEVRIMSSDNMQLAEDEVGRLQIKAPIVFEGYWQTQ